MTEIAFIAATFHGNRGAEAMVTAGIGEIGARRPDARFNVYSYYSQIDAEDVSDPRVSIYSSSPAYLVTTMLFGAILYRLAGFVGLKSVQKMCPDSVQALARSSVLICLAGVSFIDGRTKFLPFNIATLLPAWILGVPVVKFSQAMGPFKNSLNRLAAKIVLSRCRMVFARGEKTFSHLKDLLGEAPNVKRANDVAFLFKSSQSLSHGAGEPFTTALGAVKAQQARGRIVVGICPSIVVAKRATESGWNYAEMISDIIVDLERRGYSVALFPNATRGLDPAVTHNNDQPLIADIARLSLEKGAKELVLFNSMMNAADVHDLIQVCDVLAVSRFHAMVGALSHGVPVAVMGWSHKYLEVMELFGQGDMVLDYKAGDAEKLAGRIEQLVTERAERATAIKSRQDGVRPLSKLQIDFITADVL